MAANQTLVTELSADIDWESSQSHLLLNPQLDPQDRKILVELAEQTPRASTIWIASSGSARKAGESLKLIALKKSAIKASATAVNEHLKSDQRARIQDSWIQALPRYHVGGLAIEVRAQMAGIRWAEGLLNAKWNAKTFVDQIAKNQSTLSSLVPTQVHDLVEQGLRCPSSMRAIVVGGAALSDELYQKAMQLDWPLLPSFGLTECGSQVATAEISSLKSLHNKEEKIISPPLRILSHFQAEVTETGLLKLFGESLLDGWVQQRKGQTFWQEHAAQQWWVTADFVKLNKTKHGNYLQALGRETDFIKINGEGIHLFKLREILDSLVLTNFEKMMPEVALVALPHERQGSELVLAHTSALTELQATQLLTKFNDQVMGLEKMKRSILVSNIPRSALGKIQWEELRRLSLRI